MPMPIFYRAACGLLLFASLLPAQAPPPAEKKPEAAPEMTDAQKATRLHDILTAWEHRMGDIQSVSMLVTAKMTDSTRGNVEVLEGVANIQKPNMALIHMAEKANPNNFRRFMCNGRKIYEYQPRTKDIVERDMPKGNLGDNLFFTIISGMTEKDAKERFSMRYQKEVGPYAYIDFYPKKDSDKQEFTAARLVMVVDGKRFPEAFMLPRQVYFIAPNQDTQMFDLDQIKVNVKFDPKNFQVAIPTGWKVIPALTPSPAPTVPGNANGPGSLMKGIKEKN